MDTHSESGTIFKVNTYATDLFDESIARSVPIVPDLQRWAKQMHRTPEETVDSAEFLARAAKHVALFLLSRQQEQAA